MSRLTESQMKYLHVIYKAVTNSSKIRSVDIARELKITKASVSRMIKLLAEMGLIAMNDKGNITLTQKGTNEGDMIHRKVEVLHPFFTDFLELGEQEAIESVYFLLSGFPERCVDLLLDKGWIVRQK